MSFGEGFIKIRPDTAGFKDETEGHVSGVVKDLAKAATGVLAVGGAADFLKDAISNSVKFENSMETLNGTLKNNGQATDHARTVAKNYVDGLSKLSSFAKNDVAQSLNRAELGTGNLGKAMQVETISANLARRAHLGLQQTTLLVTKAYAGNTTGLKRLGISFSPVTKAQDALNSKIDAAKKAADAATGSTKKQDEATVKSLEGQKDSAKAADKVATSLAVQAKLADVAKNGLKDYANSTQGKIDAAKNSIDDLQIEIGTALLPAIGRLASVGTKYLDELVKAWPKIEESAKTEFEKIRTDVQPAISAIEGLEKPAEDAVKWLGGIGPTIEIIVGAVVAYVAVSKTLAIVTAAYEAVSVAVKLLTADTEALDAVEVANPIGLVAAALVALGVAFYEAYEHSATFRKIVDDTTTYLRTQVLPVLKDVEKDIADFISWIRTHWSQISSIIGPVARAAFALLKGYVSAPLDFIRGLIDTFGDVIHGRWSNIWGDLENLVEKPLHDVETAVTTALADIEPLAERGATAVAKEIVAGIKKAPALLEGLAGDLGAKLEAAAGQLAGEALSYGEKVGLALAKGVAKGVEGIPGEIEHALAGAVGLGSSSIDKLVANAKKQSTPSTGGKGKVDAFVTGGTDVGTILDSIQTGLSSTTLKDGKYGGGEFERKGGKWYLLPKWGSEDSAVAVPLKKDISSFVDKFIGQGVSRAQANEITKWWAEHFTGKNVVVGPGSVENLLDAGAAISQTLLKAVNSSGLGAGLTATLNQQITAAVTSAKQNLSTLTSSLASDLGTYMDAALANTDIGGTTVSKAQAKIAADAAGQQQRSLQSTLDSAKAAAATGPTPTDSDGNPLTADALATQQATLNQAVTDAQDDLDDYLLQAKITSAQNAEAVAKQSVQNQIALWTQQFNQGLISQGEFDSDIASIVIANGAPGGTLNTAYANMGDLLGTAWETSFSTHLANIQQQISDIATAGPAGTGGTGIDANVVNPIDAVSAQFVTATGTTATDTAAVNKAAAAVRKTLNALPSQAQQAKDPQAAAAAGKQYEAAVAQLAAAQASQKRDAAILAALTAILTSKGIDPNTVLAAAAR